MFFLIPGGLGGFLSFIIIFFVIRIVFRSVFGTRNTYRHFYYNSNQDQEQFYRQYQQRANANQSVYQPRKDYYAVLGLKSDATDDEVKKAYRKLIMEYHPDQISNKGLNDEIKEFATKRFREVQEAYEEICKLRGIK